MADDGGWQRIRSERQRAGTSKSATQPFLHPGPLLSGQVLQLRSSTVLHFAESVNREQERWRRMRSYQQELSGQMFKRTHLRIGPAQFLVFGSIPGAYGSDEGLLATDPNAGRNQSYSASSPLSGRLAGCSDGPHDTPS